MRKQILTNMIRCARECEQLGLYREADVLTRLAHGTLLNPDYDHDYITDDDDSENGDLLCANRRNVPNHPLNAPTKFYPQANTYLCRECAQELLGIQDVWDPYDSSKANLSAEQLTS